MITPQRAQFIASLRQLVQAGEPSGYETSLLERTAAPLPDMFIDRLLAEHPSGGDLLDAACASRESWERFRAAGFTVHAYHPPASGAAQASSRHTGVVWEPRGWREIDAHEVFQVVLFAQGMETIVPEDWPVVLNHFWNSLKPAGSLYIGIERRDPADVEAAYQAAVAQDLPVSFGEIVRAEALPAYRFFPADDKIHSWLWTAGFSVLEQLEDGVKRHFLARRRRLPTNLLDPDVDTRAGSQSP